MDNNLVTCDLIGDLPTAAAQRWGDRLALVWGERRWSYRDFNDEVNRLAAALAASGVGKGDRVAVWLNNCAEAEFLFFAVIKVGAIIVPLNTRYRVSDLAYALEQSGSVMIIAATRSGPVDYDALLAKTLGTVKINPQGQVETEGAPQLRHIVMLGESAIPCVTGWEEFQARANDGRIQDTQVVIDPADPALMVYTSGTTGDPKGVLLNHSGMRLCHDRTVIMELQGSDVQLTYLPLFHTYAISYCVIMSLMCGAHQILMDAFDADEALRLIEEKGVTVVHGFDAHFNDFIHAKMRRPRDTSSLRFGTMTVGADSSIALARTVQDRFCPTLSGYGMTEVWGGVTITPQRATIEQRCEASGVPQPGVELRVVDIETGQPVPFGEMGEIHVRSYSRMVGYHRQPAATADAIDPDGWFRTGDAGVLREDGHVRYLARYKDMLKVGGENVSPAEVELVVCSMPGIQAVAIVGQRHARLQEVPVAFVVAAAGGPCSEQAVIDFCRGKIASFKIPSRIVFVDQLPMTPTGKVQKELLRKRLAATDAPLT